MGIYDEWKKDNENKKDFQAFFPIHKIKRRQFDGNLR